MLDAEEYRETVTGRVRRDETMMDGICGTGSGLDLDFVVGGLCCHDGVVILFGSDVRCYKTNF